MGEATAQGHRSHSDGLRVTAWELSLSGKSPSSWILDLENTLPELRMLNICRYSGVIADISSMACCLSLSLCVSQNKIKACRLLSIQQLFWKTSGRYSWNVNCRCHFLMSAPADWRMHTKVGRNLLLERLEGNNRCIEGAFQSPELAHNENLVGLYIAISILLITRRRVWVVRLFSWMSRPRLQKRRWPLIPFFFII